MEDATATVPMAKGDTEKPHVGSPAHGGATLSHVNAPPAQTWNYLRANDVTLAVMAAPPKGDVVARLPHAFASIECGIGAEAVTWIESVAGDASYVEVRANETCDEPIVVTVRPGEHVDAGVLVREGATTTIAILATNADEASADDSDSATLLRVIAERGSHVNVIEVVATRGARTHLGGIGIAAADDANIDVRQYAIGCGTCALGMATDLAGSSARLALTMRYVARGGSKLDVNHVARQRGRKTEANISSSGVIAEGGEKTLRETIDLVRGAKGATGSERETVLVAGDHVVNRTLPTILCDEEDVAGNHGASIGSISADQLAYLANRGLDEAAAEALFARAVFDDAVTHAPTPELCAAVLACAADVLGDDAATDIASVLDIEHATGDDDAD